MTPVKNIHRFVTFGELQNKQKTKHKNGCGSTGRGTCWSWAVRGGGCPGQVQQRGKTLKM